MSDLSALKGKLRALKAKTVENGCTEEEALSAAEKAAELLSRHGLAEADLFGDQYDELEILVGRRSALHIVWVAIAGFADCKGWYEKRPDGMYFVYFGRDSDVLVAEYIYAVMHRACANATAEFRRSPLYLRRRKPSTRAAAVKAFHEALGASLVRKLHEGLWRRYRNNCGEAASEALALTKEKLNAEALKAGKRLQPMRAIARSKGAFIGDAQHEGFRAGGKIDVSAGVAAGNKIAGVLS